MLTNGLREALAVLVGDATEAFAGSKNPTVRLGALVAFHNSMRDEVVTKLLSFPPAVAVLSGEPVLVEHYGADSAVRLALQFVYTTLLTIVTGIDRQSAFATTWEAFEKEASVPYWRFVGVANFQNVDYSGDIADLAPGVSIQGRSFERLTNTLGWGPRELERLSQDWSDSGGASSFILLVEATQPKSADNLVLSSEASTYELAARALLALRLLAPGDIRIGRIFFSRPAAFNVGLGGLASAGFTLWNPGQRYVLTDSMIPAVRLMNATLEFLQHQLETGAKHLALALRSFTSTYDRLLHQNEDRVIDAVTALEALWKLDAELSFRLAFRTASLLATSEDERSKLFDTLTAYYKIRSRIVHGSALNSRDAALVANDAPLRDIVRRALRGFVQLAAHPGDWTLRRVAKEADATLLHGDRRLQLQKAMGISADTVA